VRVLLTGMSGTGKSALVRELRQRGCAAYDADDDGFSEPRAHGGWGWRVDRVEELLATAEEDPLFFAGCSEEQALIDFDLRVLLTAPEDVVVERLRTRISNDWGKTPPELARVRGELETVEPLLRRSADLVVDATLPLSEIADLVLEVVSSG
jgi:hypothetical protein